MRKMNTPYVKVYDLHGNRLYELGVSDNSVEATIDSLNQLKPFLQGYGRVKLVAANATIKKQSWKEPFKWELELYNQVTNNNNLPVPVQPFQMGNIPGMMNVREAELLATVKKLETDQIWNEKLSALEKKIDENNNSGFEKYLPLIGLVIDIDEKKLNNMMKIAGLSNAMNGKQGMAGLGNVQQKNTATVEGTEEEKIDLTQKLIVELCGKITIDKVIVLLKEINASPEYADMAINFMQLQKMQKQNK